MLYMYLHNLAYQDLSILYILLINQVHIAKAMNACSPSNYGPSVKSVGYKSKEKKNEDPMLHDCSQKIIL